MPGWLAGSLEILTVFALTLLAWVFFRSGSIGLAGGDSFGTAWAVLKNMSSFENFQLASVVNKFQAIKGAGLIALLLLVEASNLRFRWNERQVQQPALRLLAFAALLWLMAFLGTFNSNAFIYFQF